MPTELVIIVAAWLICGILAWGMWTAVFQRRFPTFARESFREDRALGFFWGVCGGPISLVMLLCDGGAQYGLMYRNPHKQIPEAEPVWVAAGEVNALIDARIGDVWEEVKMLRNRVNYLPTGSRVGVLEQSVKSIDAELRGDLAAAGTAHRIEKLKLEALAAHIGVTLDFTPGGETVEYQPPAVKVTLIAQPKPPTKAPAKPKGARR